MAAPRGGFYTPLTFHPAVCVCTQLLAGTSEGPHPACRQLSCPEPGWAELQPCAEPAHSAPASLSRRALPAQGTPLPAEPLGKHSWDGFGECPPAISCHQLPPAAIIGSHGHPHSRALARECPQRAQTAPGSSSNTPRAQEPTGAAPRPDPLLPA